MDLPSETTGLLPKAGAPSHSYCVKDPQRATDPVEILPKTNYEILKCIFTTAYPIAIALVLEVSCNFVSLFFASRVRNSLVPPGVIFAGVSLSTMFANVTCFSIHEGMTGAVEVFHRFDRLIRYVLWSRIIDTCKPSERGGRLPQGGNRNDALYSHSLCGHCAATRHVGICFGGPALPGGC